MNTSEPTPPEQRASALQVEVGASRRMLRLDTRWLFIFLAGIGVVAVGATVLLQAQGPQPAFGPLTASPPNFVFNTSTNVTFTIQIDTPTLNPTKVELQRVDATGALIAAVRRMHDNGQGGDARPGDQIFTAQASMNEPDIGRLYFRVAAAFRGDDHNAWSETVPVDVDPFPLPPDPGEAGKQTLEGIDSDGDGVRDDVQRWIGVNYSTSARTRAALTQETIASQRFLLSANDRAAARAQAVTLNRADDCLGYIRLDSEAVRDALLEQLLNTELRMRAYITADAQLSGAGFDLVPITKSQCDFDPDGLEN